MILSICFIVAVVPYLILVLWIWQGWRRLPRFEIAGTTTSAISISVVIPMRDEISNIGTLLNDISLQNYSQELINVWVVDDHSTDGSAEVVEAFAAGHTNITLLRLPEKEYGKKAALHHALPYLTGVLMVTTDADCRVPPNWLATIAGCYTIYRPAMMICPVMFTYDRSFFSRWQALEMMSLVGSAAATASWKHPVMCNGANLVMERSAMEHYSYVYESHIVSGDDMMMMIEIKKDSPERIMYLKSTGATVETPPPPDLKSFIRQRNRWTSKTSGYTDMEIIVVAIIVFLANLSIVVSLVAGIFCIRFLWLALALWGTKMLVDVPFLYSLTRFWNRKELMRIFLPAQLLYPFYITWVGIAGNMAPVKWKGRKSKI